MSVAVQTFPTATLGGGCCFDGTHIWLLRCTGNETITLQTINPADGSQIASFSFDIAASGNGPGAIIFDNGFLWLLPVANLLLQVDPSDGALLNSYPVVTAPDAILQAPADLCADATGHVWVSASYLDGSFSPQAIVVQFRESDGGIESTTSVGGFVQDICFDGEFIWAAGRDSGNLYKIAADGSIAATGAIGGRQLNVIFDGTHIWTTDGAQSLLWQVDAATAAAITSFDLGGLFPFQLQTDAAPHIWLLLIDFNTNILSVNIYDTAGALLEQFPLAVLSDGGTAMVFAAGSMWTAGVDLVASPVIVRMTLATLAAGIFQGTHAGFWNAGRFGGGAK